MRELLVNLHWIAVLVMVMCLICTVSENPYLRRRVVLHTEHREHIFTRDETGLVYISAVSAHSAGAYTASLLVMVKL
jgi:hypothetical protein